jgi:hypothetical protein
VHRVKAVETAGLKQQDRGVRLLDQPAGDYTAGRSTAGDDIVKSHFGSF